MRNDAANELASVLEEDIRLDPLAITINETDERHALWELVLYFESEEVAEQPAPLNSFQGASSPQCRSRTGCAARSKGWRPSPPGASTCTARMTGRSGGQVGVSLEIDAGTAFAPDTTARRRAALWRSTAS